MGTLFRKLLRDLKDAKGQFIAILIIIIIGVTFYTGINSTFKNLSRASVKYYEDYSFADIWASIYNAPEAVLEKINALPYVKMSIGRVINDSRIIIADENAVVRLVTLPDNRANIVNDVVLKSGRYFSSDESNQCLVEEEFFKAHSLKIGSYIKPIVNGNEVNLKVVGYVKSPEFVYMLKDVNDLMNDSRKFGVVYIKKSFGQSILGFNGAINDVAMVIKKGTDIEKAKDDVTKILKPFGIKGVIDRKDQTSNRMLNEEIKQLSTMGKAFPVIFFIVAAVIIYIMMGRMVENQRAQIGVLKAFGYRNYYILAHYMSYPIFLGVLGSIVGTIFGMLLGQWMTELENMYFHMPLNNMKVYPELAVPASLIILFFCILAGYKACKLAFMISPVEAMRPKTPKMGKKIIVEKIRFIWNRLDFGWKMVMRNIFRYKKRAILTSVGIIISAMILLMGFGMGDSINVLLERQYGDILNYDVKVNFSGLLSIEEINLLKNISHVEQVEPMVEVGVEVSNGWKSKDAGLIALIDKPELYRLIDKDGDKISIPDNGIVLPAKLARTLGVKLGDKVFLKPYLFNKDKKEMIIQGLIEQCFGLNVYSNFKNISSFLGEGRIFNSAVLKIESSAYEEEVKHKLNEMQFISSIQLKREAGDSLRKNLGILNTFNVVVIILAGVLCIAVVYNITTINIFERQRELAILKILGLKNREVRKVVFGENYVITAVGVDAAFPLGKWLDKYLATTIYETDMYTLPVEKSAGTYVITIVSMLAFTVITNYILDKKIKKLNIVEVLKSNE